MADSHDTSIALLEQQVDTHSAQLDRLTSAVEAIGAALGKLAVLEERHNETKLAIDRAFAEMRASRNEIEVRTVERDARLDERLKSMEARLDERLKALEGGQGKWTDRLLMAMLAAAATVAVAKVFA